MAKPDAILFNGGFCVPPVARERIVAAVAGWFREQDRNWQPKVLENAAMDTAVAIGAAYYGRVRRGAGLRIRAGNARTYYIATRSEDGLQGVCVLPSGVDEGTTLALTNREFTVLANRPVSFTLYSSRVRHDNHGDIATLEEDQVHRHAPLVTLLRYGKKLRQVDLAVRLTASFTEVGTLELWCESLTTPHRWRLQFELRAKEREAQHGDELEADAGKGTPRIAASAVSPQSLDAAARLMRATFSKTNDGSDAQASAPEKLVSILESTLALKRDSWPIATIRELCDVLIQVADGRKRTPEHEVRWLNLTGFCLRPGFGARGDDMRVNQVRKLYQAGMTFPRDVRPQVEWLVLWRRIAGGLNASQQHQLYKDYSALLGVGRNKPGTRLNTQVEHEGWRLLASLEHLPSALRTSLGNEVLAKVKKEPTDSAWLWSLGRLGARIPVYGPLNSVVSPETASQWIEALLELRDFTAQTAAAIVHLGSRTDDRSRDIDAKLAKRAIARIKAAGSEDELTERLESYVPPSRGDAQRAFGESLPQGLHLISSANCLLPVTALTSDSAQAV